MSVTNTKMQTLLAKAPTDIRFKMGIVCPEDGETLRAPILAAKQGIIEPILIGSLLKIKKAAESISEDISMFECIHVNSDEEAAMRAVSLTKEGYLNALMKGSLHTDIFMSKVVSREGGLRTERRMTHGMLADIPGYHKLIVFSDVAFNIEPTLKDKKDIVQNAIDFAISLGVPQPKVALLSSVDTPSDKVRSSTDSDELCKMAMRGEIQGGILSGPIQFDAAYSLEAAKVKKIDSPVAGDADIMIFPNLDSGNIAAKALELCGQTTCYGIALGVKVPVVVTSRASSAEARVGSCILAKFYAKYLMQASLVSQK